jgi:RNA polymerase sigma factor (sigma-70 family)
MARRCPGEGLAALEFAHGELRAFERRYLSGSAGTFEDMDLEAVAAALAPRLLAYLTARTGSRSLAEDVAQDALVALVQCWRRRGPPESPEAFAFAIAKRRAGRALARRALLAPIDALLGRRHTAVAVDAAMAHRQALAAVLRDIRRLPRRDRKVLLLSAAGELRIADIAAVTGASPAAVKMRLSRARRRLLTSHEGTANEPARTAE